MPKRQLESFYQELVKQYITKKVGCIAIRELNLGGPTFDVVGFDPQQEEFHVVECKRTSRAVGIGQTFGQILAYEAVIYEKGESFLDAFEGRLQKDVMGKIGFWQHAARFVSAKRIPVRFYVALRQNACDRLGLLRLIKRDLQNVGIIRITNRNACRDYIRDSGEKNYEICRSEKVNVPISMPVRPQLRAILKKRNSSDDIGLLAAAIDKKILSLKRDRIQCVTRGKGSLYYRVSKNFVSLHLKNNFVTVRTKDTKKWKLKRITRSKQIPALIRRIKKALSKSLHA